MTAEQLREFKHKTPFKPFNIHMNDGSKLVVDDPENLVLPRGWTTDAIVTKPRGRFSFVYLRNVSHVSSEGGFRSTRRKRRGGSGGESE